MKHGHIIKHFGLSRIPPVYFIRKSTEFNYMQNLCQTFCVSVKSCAPSSSIKSINDITDYSTCIVLAKLSYQVIHQVIEHTFVSTIITLQTQTKHVISFRDLN